MFNPNRGETRADGVPHEATGRDEFPDLLVAASGLVETRLGPKQQPVLERMAPTSMSQDTFETCRRTFGTGLTVPYLRIDRTDRFQIMQCQNHGNTEAIGRTDD